MSNPKRMTVTWKELGGGNTGKTEWVSIAEYTRLKAEYERLTANTDKLCKHGDLEIARLKAENERLRKAGDAMAKTIGENGVHDNGSFHDVADSIDQWHTAKEGKPSV